MAVPTACSASTMSVSTKVLPVTDIAFIQAITAIVIGTFGVGSGLHALLHKRNPGATLNWTLVCLFIPFFGAIGYWLLGANRILTRARGWQQAGLFSRQSTSQYETAAIELAQFHPERAGTLQSLEAIAKRVTEQPLLGHNNVEPLYNGEQAYPAMLAAIASAKQYVFLSTYIFETKTIGRDLIVALGQASERGVDVRVLIDAIGERYARPRATKLLKKYPKVKTARFLPLSLSRRGLNINLRNHRKLLVVDGQVGFTGGMNIGRRHLVEDPKNRKKTVDVHFAISGPSAGVIADVFLEDWRFSVGDEVQEKPIANTPPLHGEALCRGIKDGPNEDFGRLQWILVGAIGCAQKRIQIVTPYFLPTVELTTALNAAALRGVIVDIVLPAKNNLPIVAWASQGLLEDVIQYGVRVYYQPPPFNHSKLFVVDEFYSIVGSANLDPRSLVLNFEFNLEIYDEVLGKKLSSHIDSLVQTSTTTTLETLKNFGFWRRLRNSLARLGAPYL